MVIAQSLFITLKQRFPGRSLHVLAPPSTAPLLAYMPEVDESIAMAVGHGALGLGARRTTARRLAERGYGWALILPNSFKSALVAYWADIPRRTGYDRELRRILLTDARRLDKQRLPRTVDRFVALAQPNASPPGDVPAPSLRVSAVERDAAMRSLGLDRHPSPVLGLCPGAEYGPAKQWPASHYAELARRHVADGGQVWLFGAPGDAGVAGEIAALAGTGCFNLAGRTTLGQAVSLLSAVDAVVSNDSGLMHVAAALGRPVVAVYGSSSPAMTPPLSPRARPVSLNLPCSPCFKRTCPLGHLNCLRQLKPDIVRATLDEVRLGEE